MATPPDCVSTNPHALYEAHMYIAEQLLDVSPGHSMEAALEAHKAACALRRADLMAEASYSYHAAMMLLTTYAVELS